MADVTKLPVADRLPRSPTARDQESLDRYALDLNRALLEELRALKVKLNEVITELNILTP